jgi:RHS repeat-associated protein
VTDGVYSAGYTYLANSALVGQITFRQGTNVRLTTTRAYDGNGNVTALIDAATGALLTQYEYGPFGEPIRVSGALAKTNPFRFSTKYQDDETDLLYYGYRYYGPSAGRWTSRDPIGEDAEANLYAFVANSPLSQVDLLGQILVGVDGTGSAKWLEFPGSGRHNSHVKNFCDDYGGRRAYYLHGPDTLGVSTAYLARRVYDTVCAAKRWDSFESVHLIGFSRGGAAVIRAAQLLKEEKCGCDQAVAPPGVLTLMSPGRAPSGQHAEGVKFVQAWPAKRGPRKEGSGLALRPRTEASPCGAPQSTREDG